MLSLRAQGEYKDDEEEEDEEKEEEEVHVHISRPSITTSFGFGLGRTEAGTDVVTTVHPGGVRSAHVCIRTVRTFVVH